MMPNNHRQQRVQGGLLGFQQQPAHRPHGGGDGEAVLPVQHHNNNNHPNPGAGRHHQQNGDQENRENRDPNLQYCSVPHGCERYAELIHVDDPADAVRVACNNDACTVGQWMHGDCFRNWEQQVLSYLRSCGRARSWSEKQRLQNLWTKKGYDLAYKACDCKCGKGHLRKDLDYITPPKTEEQRRHKKHKNKGQKPLPALQKNNHPTQNQGSGVVALGIPANNSNRPQLRVRTSSFSSTGSSPPSSAGTPPLTPGGAAKKGPHFEFFADAEQAAAGNIFKRRTDFSAFSCLPRHQQNPYHIKMEDEGPYGNDEIRCFVLSNLSSHQVTEVRCVVCQNDMPVFDRYPLIDGTFFLSPHRYNTDMQVLNDHRLLYLNSICMKCLEGNRQLRCIACKKQWRGTTLVLGTMYAYDIFAASPCCAYRLSCKNCRRAIIDTDCGFNFYSEYSRTFQCPHCRTTDYHFIKPLAESFCLNRQPICNNYW